MLLQPLRKKVMNLYVYINYIIDHLEIYDLLVSAL